MKTFDIRRPICIDVVFDVLEGERVLAPNIHIYDAEGTPVFVSIDQDQNWNRRPRPVGQLYEYGVDPRKFSLRGFVFGRRGYYDVPAVRRTSS